MLLEGSAAGVRAVPRVHRQPERPAARRVDGLRAAGPQGDENSVKDPNLRTVLKFRSTSPFIQLYLDQAYSAAIGQALNGAIAKQFAGKATPAQVVAQIEAAAKKK